MRNLLKDVFLSSTVFVPGAFPDHPITRLARRSSRHAR